MSNQCDMNSQMQVRALVLQNECGRYRIGPCQCDLPRTISRIQPASFLHANAINKSFSLVVVGRYEMMIDIILVAISVFRVSLYILKERLLRNVLCFFSMFLSFLQVILTYFGLLFNYLFLATHKCAVCFLFCHQYVKICCLFYPKNKGKPSRT